MIKKFIYTLLGKSATRPAQAAKNPFGKREQVSAQRHGINPQWVDERAHHVVRTLQHAGFQAYIVGGAVRDLLVGLRPKDFDVATDATPEQVKSLFRRAFIIGRRFRIVHVVYGRGREHEVIEVSTFRAHLDHAAAEQVAGNEKTSKSELAGMHHAVDVRGRVLRDNVWGTQEEDAARRDFTINAMYYDPETQILVDYHNGFKDTKNRILRMIGEPATRYLEDPVRIIRAVRFAAKLSPLGFELESRTAAPLVKSQQLLADVPQSRLFDEMLKLLQTGHALASVNTLKKLGMAQGIYPLLDVVVQRVENSFVNAALKDTDRRVEEGKSVAPSFLLACVLWVDVRDAWAKRLGRGQHAHSALQEAIDETFDARIGDVSGRGKLAADMREIWMMQPRFEKRVGHAPMALMEQPRFRAAFDFMRLRADAGEVQERLADWWQAFSVADVPLRQDLIDQAREEQQRQRGTGRVQRAPKPTHGQAAAVAPRADSTVASRIPAPSKTEQSLEQGTLWGADSEADIQAQHSDAAMNSARKPRRRRRRSSGSVPPGGDSAGGPDGA